MNAETLKDLALLALILLVAFFGNREITQLRIEMTEVKTLLRQGLQPGKAAGPDISWGARQMPVDDQAERYQAIIAENVARSKRHLSSVTEKEAGALRSKGAGGPLASDLQINLNDAVLMVNLTGLSRSLAKADLRATGQGLLVNSVAQYGVLALLELKSQDVLLEYDGKPIREKSDLGVMLQRLKQRGESRLKLQRAGRELEAL